ncbi:MAG: hypothetical protein AB7I36_14580 [Rhodospirillaceae bacterium]
MRFSVLRQFPRAALMAIALIASAPSVRAQALEAAVPKLAIDEFLIGQRAAETPEHEKAASVDGSNYAVVAPLYLGAGGGMISYLRLFNGGSATASFSVKVVGSPTGRDYGTATFQVPPSATRQYALFQVLQGAGATVTEPDTNYSFYIQSDEPLAGYQHVTHSPSVSYFENASICRATIQDVVRDATKQMMLSSVHTSRLASAGYPSSIELHNFANTVKTYRIAVKDETAGTDVGQMDVTAQANASYTIPWSQIESSIDWAPTSEQIRANVFVTDSSGASPAILLGQTINNDTLRVTLNMTTMCAVNASDGDQTPPTTATLTVTKVGSGAGTVTSSTQPGITCGPTCTATVDVDRTLTLTAVAASGSRFLGWGGACTNTTGVCEIPMTSNKTVTATFAASTLTVQKIGNGSGTVTSSPAAIDCGNTCSAAFTATTLSLTAIPASGSTFLGWGGCTSTSGNGGTVCNVTYESDRTVSATFGTNVVEVQKIGSGTVTSSPAGISCGGTCAGSYAMGAVVSLTATPASGMNVDFLGWGGCTSVSGPNGTICTITVSGNHIATATFR